MIRAALTALLLAVIPARVPSTPILINSTLTATGNAVVVQVPAGEVDLLWNIGTVTGTTPSLTFAITPGDPLNTGTALTGGNAATSTAITSGPVTGELVLATLQSSAVRVSWTITGTTPSFAGVYLTLAIKDPLY